MAKRTIETSVLDSTGHTKTTWDASSADEVAAAKKQFTELTSKGFRAFKVKRDGSEGEVMRTFDPDAEAIIYSKALQGG